MIWFSLIVNPKIFKDVDFLIQKNAILSIQTFYFHVLCFLSSEHDVVLWYEVEFFGWEVYIYKYELVNLFVY